MRETDGIEFFFTSASYGYGRSVGRSLLLTDDQPVECQRASLKQDRCRPAAGGSWATPIGTAAAASTSLSTRSESDHFVK